MINPTLNVGEISESFTRDKSVQILDFLDEQESIKLYDWLNGDMPEDWWFTSIVGDHDGVENIQNKPDARELINIKIKGANETFLNGGWSYVFDKTQPHRPECHCVECKFIAFLKSKVMLSFLKSVTEIDIKRLRAAFSSRYLPNFFLSTHPDRKRGKIGFTYSLSKDWRPEWGGNLHFLTDDYKTVTRTVVPVFNKLTLFDVPWRDGTPHYVSHVVSDVKTKRLSVSGWFG